MIVGPIRLVQIFYFILGTCLTLIWDPYRKVSYVMHTSKMRTLVLWQAWDSKPRYKAENRPVTEPRSSIKKV